MLTTRVSIFRGDITQVSADIIVNAANGALCGGGGVDGAIHHAAGPGLLEECRTLGHARPGDVKITGAYRLSARYVAHAVGPVWSGGNADEDEQLERCYARSLTLAIDLGQKSIVFPSISTGAYRFPLERATRIALSTTRDILSIDKTLNRVMFCCFTDADLKVYQKIWHELQR